MAKKFRVFTSFAIEDANLRTMLIGQGRNKKTPFEFVDMSVKEPWDSAWKTNCRTKIKGCDGVIGIITKNTPKASGQLWELQQESIITSHCFKFGAMHCVYCALHTGITNFRT